MPRKKSTRADSKASKQLNARPKPSPKTSKAKTLTKLRDELDYWFSRYIRAKYADTDGTVECYTCKRRYLVGKAQAGHFASRRHMATRWDEDNVRPQCYGCNITNQGQQWLFGRYLDNERPGKAEEVMQRAQSSKRNEVGAMRAAVEYYRAAADHYTTTKGLTFRKDAASAAQRGKGRSSEGRGRTQGSVERGDEVQEHQVDDQD